MYYSLGKGQYCSVLVLKAYIYVGISILGFYTNIDIENIKSIMNYINEDKSEKYKSESFIEYEKNIEKYLLDKINIFNNMEKVELSELSNIMDDIFRTFVIIFLPEILRLSYYTDKLDKKVPFENTIDKSLFVEFVSIIDNYTKKLYENIERYCDRYYNKKDELIEFFYSSNCYSKLKNFKFGSYKAYKKLFIPSILIFPAIMNEVDLYNYNTRNNIQKYMKSTNILNFNNITPINNASISNIDSIIKLTQITIMDSFLSNLTLEQINVFSYINSYVPQMFITDDYPNIDPNIYSDVFNTIIYENSHRRVKKSNYYYKYYKLGGSEKCKINVDILKEHIKNIDRLDGMYVSIRDLSKFEYYPKRFTKNNILYLMLLPTLFYRYMYIYTVTNNDFNDNDKSYDLSYLNDNSFKSFYNLLHYENYYNFVKDEIDYNILKDDNIEDYWYKYNINSKINSKDYINTNNRFKYVRFYKLVIQYYNKYTKYKIDNFNVERDCKNLNLMYFEKDSISKNIYKVVSNEEKVSLSTLNIKEVLFRQKWNRLSRNGIIDSAHRMMNILRKDETFKDEHNYDDILPDYPINHSDIDSNNFMREFNSDEEEPSKDIQILKQERNFVNSYKKKNILEFNNDEKQKIFEAQRIVNIENRRTRIEEKQYYDIERENLSQDEIIHKYADGGNLRERPYDRKLLRYKLPGHTLSFTNYISIMDPLSSIGKTDKHIILLFDIYDIYYYCFSNTNDRNQYSTCFNKTIITRDGLYDKQKNYRDAEKHVMKVKNKLNEKKEIFNEDINKWIVGTFLEIFNVFNEIEDVNQTKNKRLSEIQKNNKLINDFKNTVKDYKLFENINIPNNNTYLYIILTTIRIIINIEDFYDKFYIDPSDLFKNTINLNKMDRKMRGFIFKIRKTTNEDKSIINNLFKNINNIVSQISTREKFDSELIYKKLFDKINEKDKQKKDKQYIELDKIKKIEEIDQIGEVCNDYRGENIFDLKTSEYINELRQDYNNIVEKIFNDDRLKIRVYKKERKIVYEYPRKFDDEDSDIGI